MQKLCGLALAAIAILAVPSGARSEKVALTFDDLPLNGELAPGMTRAGIVRDVLQVLRKHRVPPVYGFVNAQRMEGAPDGAEALRMWVAGGQRVGNHSYSHPDLSRTTTEEFLAEVRRNEPVLQLLDPGNGWHWFRYPYLREGETLEKRRAVRQGLAARGYRIAQVTLDYEDYLWNSPFSRCVAQGDRQGIAWLRSSYLETATRYLELDREMARRVYGRPIDHVLLLHLGAYSSTILPALLELLHAQGFELATLEEVQRDAIYAGDPDGASAQGGSLVEQWMDVRKLPYPTVPPKPRQQLTGICTAAASKPTGSAD
ncbi:MAG TPA: polysaccharide deacetylase family protein [Steroidobacteraceae bacterium]|nr:polysaccharide deacetylase family protein [Steroidobacteraceae bacterium]